MSSPAEPSFRDALPSCYRHLLPAFFDKPRPPEPHATCDRCTMLPPPGVDPESGRFFRPDTKCCTFHPFLPNYSVGGLLVAEETNGSLGRERIRQRLAQGEGVVPGGIRSSARYAHRYRGLVDSKDGSGEFGRSLALRCPYYDEAGGSCSVWAFREAACTTWFCKLRHGRDGLTFWSSLRTYLHALESLFARHCLRELGFSEDRVLRSVELPTTAEAASHEEGPAGEAARRALWGEWLGREQDLYATCYRTVLVTDAAALARLGGDDLARDLDRLEEALRRMLEPERPPLLRRNPRAEAVRRDGGWMVTAYTAYDPVGLSDAVWEALAFFDGRTPTGTVRERIQAERGYRLSDGLLTRLVQLEVLVRAE